MAMDSPTTTESTGQGTQLAFGDAPPFQWTRDVVRRLEEDAAWALASNPSGAAEVAGVLLGRGRATIDILDCQPLFVMQEQDHAYALNGPGRREFERVIAWFRAIPESELSVVGFYRSHLGDQLELTEEDRGLLRTCFRDTCQVTLLINITRDQACRVRLFLGDDGRLVSDFHSAGQAAGLPKWLELWQDLSAPSVHPAGRPPVPEPAQVSQAEVLEAEEVLEPGQLAEPAQLAQPAEVAEAVETTEAVETVDAVELAEPGEVAEAGEVVEPVETAEAVAVAEPAEVAQGAAVAEPARTPEIAETAEPTEAAEAAEVAEPAETAERAEVAEPARTVQTAETIGTAEVAEPTEVAEAAETRDGADVAEPAEVAETAEVAEPAETAEAAVGQVEAAELGEVASEAPPSTERWEHAAALEHVDTVEHEETPIAAKTEAPDRMPLASRRLYGIEQAEPVPAAPRRRSFRAPAFLIAAAALVALLVGYPMFKQSAKLKQDAETFGPAPLPPQSGSSAASELGLQAEKHGDDLLVEWNRGAPLLVGASRGMLIIREGNGHETSIMVDGNLLRDGSIVYRPVQNDVSLRLVIVGQSGAELGESVTTYPPPSDSEKEKK